MSATPQRCELTELLVDQCACRLHRAPPPPPPPPPPEIGARFTARYDSRCAGCGESMQEGDRIAKTTDHGYLCEACW